MLIGYVPDSDIQVPHCLIRFFTNRPKSVILFYSEVFFSQPSFSEFLIFELYKKLLLPQCHIQDHHQTKSKCKEKRTDIRVLSLRHFWN